MKTIDDKAEYWRGVVSKYECSGLSQVKFSAQEGIVKHRLFYWVRKFRDNPSISAESNKFVEIPVMTPQKEQVELHGVEIEFPSGMILKVRG